MKGPVKAGTSDLTIYKSGLKDKIPAGKKAVTDNGYRNKSDSKLAPPNSHDAKELRTSKLAPECDRKLSTDESRTSTASAICSGMV